MLQRRFCPTSRPPRICTFECTFCANVRGRSLANTCLNCGGELRVGQRRPVIETGEISPSIQRIYEPDGCLNDRSLNKNELAPWKITGFMGFIT